MIIDDIKKDKLTAQSLIIDTNNAGQRLDNFLILRLKTVPKSKIYRFIRKGEVRVNSGRIKPEYKLIDGDKIRIPPLYIIPQKKIIISPKLHKVALLEQSILFEDDFLLAINKPSGLAVHGGSNLSYGLIEALRALRPTAPFLELVHRLDRETSGVILIAKKRSMLRALHQQLREQQIKKTYLTLVAGKWSPACTHIKNNLEKIHFPSGEWRTKVSQNGKPSETEFKIKTAFAMATLLYAKPLTGRTHQIRVHAKCAGHPIACDERYGEAEFNQSIHSLTGLSRLFLHAASLQFYHPISQQLIMLEAPVSKDLQACLEKLSTLSL